MDRVAAMLMLLGFLVAMVLMLMALFSVAPVFTSCLVSLLYTLYLFFTNEESGIHHAQEFENRFWTVFALFFSAALFFANDSPIAFGRWSPNLGVLGVILSGYAMHTWDRYLHRVAISRQVALRRSSTANSSLVRLKDLGIPVEDQLAKINESLADIDQVLIPSTINNFINQRFVMRKEREIINVMQECDARALNYILARVKLGLLFYKIKDHRNFSGQHRTELIQLLAVDRLPVLTVLSRVIVLHALQLMKLRAHKRAEYWVRNIILCTHQEDLSALKTMTDAKGDYFSMNKLIHDDIRTETIRQDILNHIRKEAAVQQAHVQMGTKKGKERYENKAYRKVLSDVDDTLTSSGGSYPAGIDKRFSKKVVYPGVLSFYREMDLGTKGPEEWPDNKVGNLVFLSARPHVYKDMSEKINFAKFEKLRLLGTGRKGMHTMPSLLAGDIASGRDYVMTNDMEPLALKKFDNFKRYVAIYPEFNHVFICDNGQGDVRAGELMHDAFPYEFEALYVHVVQDIPNTHGYAPERWKAKGLQPIFFRTYPEAALHAVRRNPPMIRVSGLRRVCQDAVKDFEHITPKQWSSTFQKTDRRAELNQSFCQVNEYLESLKEEPVALIEAERLWEDGQQVRTPYGIARVISFDPEFDMYEVEIDMRPLNLQVAEHQATMRSKTPDKRQQRSTGLDATSSVLETVVEAEESEDERSVPIELRNQQSLTTGTIPRIVRLDETASESSESRHGGVEAPVEPVMTPGEVTCEQPNERTEQSETHTEGETPSVAIPNVPADQLRLHVTARIRGRDITKYTPPVLPKIEKRTSLFSFWTAPAETPKKPSFKSGDKCNTPFGPGTITSYRDEDGVVVVEMTGWKGLAYLQQSDVQVVSHGIFRTLRRLTSIESPSRPVPLEFPYVEGTLIKTPFGDGTVSQPIPVSAKDAPSVAEKTLGISLTSWMLADQTHPMLYCTVETARSWKENKGAKSHGGDGLFSALGGFFRLKPRPSEIDKKAVVAESKAASQEPPTPKFEQYYRDGAAVTTSYGNGQVKRFRENDGFYEISLVDWPLANGRHPIAILRKDDVSHRIAKGCHEGYPVLTNLGLTGILESVEPTTGMHIVTVQSAGMVCYLQPQQVIRPLKACKDQVVLTAYGEGKVLRYRVSDDVYIIQLNGGWNNATLYAKAETFDRDEQSMQHRGGALGMKWLLGFLFSSPAPSVSDGRGGRSRSNSLVSVSRKSQNGSVRSGSIL